jgi:hypothetical protein
MGLARAFSQQRLWTEAIASAEEAARHAPSVPERVSALALAAQGAIAAGEPAKGCGLLKTAGDLQHSGAIQEQLTRLRCAQ